MTAPVTILKAFDLEVSDAATPIATIRPVRRILVLVIVFVVVRRWREKRFEASDKAGGFGAYAPMRPVRGH